MKTESTFLAAALLTASPLGCGADSSLSARDTASAASSSAHAGPPSSARPEASSAPLASVKRDEPPPASGPRPSDAELKGLTKANNAFAFALWSKAGATKGDLAFSPFSIESALVMTWLGAKGETAAQMKKALGFDGDASAAADLVGRYGRSLGGTVTFQFANRLFGERTFSFEKPFLDETAKALGAPLEPMDFAHAADPSREHINQWVAAQTHDRIKDLLPPGAVTEDTKLALVNAIYFLGDWQTPFKKEATRPAAFHTTASAQHDVPTMNELVYAPFAEDEDVSVVDLQYQGGAFSMTLVLPKKVDGLDAVEKKLSADRFDKWTLAEHGDKIAVALPKFTIDPPGPMSLGDALVGMGMSDAFDRKKADLGGIAAPAAPEDRLAVSKVLHKAFVKVDEKGTEAAAATAVLVEGAGAAPASPPRQFIADHPFLFFLRDVKSNTILFAGRVADPIAK